MQHTRSWQNKIRIDFGIEATANGRGIVMTSKTPEPGFEPESKAPQACRISRLPHSGSYSR